MRATNKMGAAGWSQAKNWPQQPTTPAAPTITVKYQYLKVSWTAPSANDAAITDYDVRYRACTATPKTCPDADDTWGTWTTLTGAADPGNSITATIASLTKATTYQVQVRATNNIGVGAWSASTTGIPAAVPGAPAAPTLTVKHESLDVSWSAPSDDGGSAVTDYDVRYRACTKSADLTCATDDTCVGISASWTNAYHGGTDTEHTITGLTNGKTYKVRVRAENNRGSGGWSTAATATPATTPDAPDTPSLAVNDRSLDVSWTAPTETGGAPITGYKLQYRACTATPKTCTGDNPTWGNWKSRSHSGTGVTNTISSLTNGTTYEVQVVSRNRVGDSSWSSSASGSALDTDGSDGGDGASGPAGVVDGIGGQRVPRHRLRGGIPRTEQRQLVAVHLDLAQP